MIRRDLAKCVDFDLQVEDHGILILSGEFEYEEGGHQGLGYGVDADFLKRFLQVFGWTSLKGVQGESCWVTHDNMKIYKIEPLHKKGGKPFDITAWSEKREKAHV